MLNSFSLKRLPSLYGRFTQKALPLALCSLLCLSATGCIPDSVSPFLQWIPGLGNAGKSGANAAPSVALPPEIPQPGLATLPLLTTEDSTLAPDPVLVDTTLGEATALGLASAEALNEPSFQQQPITKATFAQWLVAWAEPQKPLPKLPEADLSPYADVDSSHPQLDALRLAEAQQWLPVGKSVNGSPVYIHPTQPITIEQLFTSTLSVQAWLNGQPSKPAASLSPAALYTEAKDSGLTETLFGKSLDEPAFTAQLSKPASQLKALMVMAFWL